MTSFDQEAIPKVKPIVQPKTAKLALYGGGFDPVHLAHLKIARAALAHMGDGSVCFIPAAHSPLKNFGPTASAAARIAMLELAVKNEPNFLLDDLEIRRGGRSFTIDSVATFKAVFPTIELFWIIGGDQFAQLDSWAEINRLKTMVTFLVVARPGFLLRNLAVDGLHYDILEIPLMEDSSSELRARSQRGDSIHELVPKEVEAFISKRGLYSP